MSQYNKTTQKMVNFDDVTKEKLINMIQNGRKFLITNTEY